MLKRFNLAIAFVLVLVGGVLPLPAGAQQAEPDYAIAGGRFFTQANGQGGDGGTGFSVYDDNQAKFWTEFQRYGGVTALGYPTSRRFMWDGFVVQATQKVVMQWRPEIDGVMFVNVFDVMSERGLDGWLDTVRQTPSPFSNEADAGLSFDQIVKRHQDFLESSPAIKAKYFDDANPLQNYGLPISYKDYGNVFVVRAQRAVFQVWKEDVPWAKAGTVTIANGGDIAKEANLFPQAATAPEKAGGEPGLVTAAAPAPTAAPTQAPVAQATPAPGTSQYPYAFTAISWEPNCSITQVKLFVRDVGGTAVNGVRFRVESGAWNATSNPTGQAGVYNAGWTDFLLRPESFTNTWTVYAVDDSGNRQSESYQFRTEKDPCAPGSGGKNVASITFTKGGQSQAQVQPTAAAATAAPTQAATGATPTPAPSGGNYNFQQSAVQYEPNCGITRARMFVRDSSGKPVNGVKFKIQSGGWNATSNPTGQAGVYDAGWSDFLLRGEAYANNWTIYVVDDSGNRISDEYRFQTTSTDCQPGGKGQQVATITWTKVR